MSLELLQTEDAVKKFQKEKEREGTFAEGWFLGVGVWYGIFSNSWLQHGTSRKFG